MNRIKILALLATVVLLALMPINLFAQQPEAPHKFYGTVTLADGSVAPDGTTVGAWVDGEEVATTTVTSYEPGFYLLDVAPAVGDTFIGEMVTFTVDGTATDDSVAWQTRGSQELNLASAEPAEPAEPAEAAATATPVAPAPIVTAPEPVDTDAIKDDIMTSLLLELALNSPSDGSDGSDGQDGATGATGAIGATGSAGPAGSAGSAGPAGTDGAAGAAGDSGQAGATGGVGPEGESGGGGLAIFALILAIVALLGAGGAFAMGRRS